MSNMQQFNFNQIYTIPSPDRYIKGINCTSGVISMYSTYFVEYKRAIQNSKPSQE